MILSTPLICQDEEEGSSFGPTSIAKGKIYALIIGISNYEDPKIDKLEFAHRDAEIFYDYLRSPAGGSVPEKQIKLLTETNATISNIYVAKQWLENSVTEDDMVFFYFSGHGDVESSAYKLGFLLAYDTPHKNYFNNAVRIEDFNIMANTLSEQKNVDVVMITDACHSGKLGETNLTKVQKNEIRIASCESSQKSWEDQAWGGGRGAFSFHLINGLQGLADKNTDQVVTVKELRRFLEDRVPNDVAKVLSKIQEPVVATTQEDRNKLIALVDEETLKATRALDSLHKAGKSSSKSIEINQNVQNRYFNDLGVISLKNSYDFYDLSSKEPEEIIDYFLINYKIPYNLLKNYKDSLWYDSVHIKSIYREEYQQQLAATIHSDVQRAINAYIRGDQVEAEKRDYYYSKDSDFVEYSAMLETAMKLIDSNNYLYSMMDMKRHYFNGVNARLGAYFVEDKDSLLQYAIAEQEMALTLEDRAAYIYQELGEIANTLDSLHSAKQYFGKALELAPNWSQPLIGLSNIYIKEEQHYQAEKYAKKAIESQEDNFYGYYYLGVCAVDDGDFLIAEENFLKAIRRNDKHYLPFEQLGFLNIELGNYQKADDYFNESEIRKKFVEDKFSDDFYSSMWSSGDGTSLMLYTEYDSTLFGPNDDMAYFAYGLSKFNNGKYKAAEIAFKKVISINYKDPLVYRYLGELMVKQERWMEAELYFQFAQEMYLSSDQFIVYEKDLYKKQEYQSSAIREEYKNAHYEAIGNKFFLARIYENWGYYSKAENIYYHILKTKEEFFEPALLKCCRLYVNQHLFDQAESLIKKHLHHDKIKWRTQLIGMYDQWMRLDKENWLPTYKAGELTYNLYFQEKDTVLLNDELIVTVPGTKEDLRLEYYTYNKVSLYEITNNYEKALLRNNRMDTVLLAHINQRLGDLYHERTGHSDNLIFEEKSEAYYQKAADLLPSPSNKEKLIQRSNNNSNYSNAFKELQYLRERDQLSFEGIVQLGEYHVKTGSLDEDENILDLAASVYPTRFTKTTETKALNELLDGDYQEAIRLFTSLLDLPDTENHDIHYTIARMYADDEMADKAFEHLEIALESGFDQTWVLDFDPYFDDYRENSNWLRLRRLLPPSNIDEKLQEIDDNVYLRPISR